MEGGATARNAGAQKLEKPGTLQGTQPYRHLDISQGDQLQPSGPQSGERENPPSLLQGPS